MKARTAITALTALTLVAGCRDDATESPVPVTPYEELAVAADTAEGFGREAPAGVTPVQGGGTQPGALTATGNFQGTSPDAPPGSVTITQEGQQTRILISLQRYTAGAEIQPSIVAARCGERGAIVQAVPQVIRVPETGIASLDTSVNVPAERILDGRHSVRLTTPRGDGAADVELACADLPRTAPRL
jgi:hypothetical protein